MVEEAPVTSGCGELMVVKGNNPSFYGFIAVQMNIFIFTAGCKNCDDSLVSHYIQSCGSLQLFRAL